MASRYIHDTQHPVITRTTRSTVHAFNPLSRQQELRSRSRVSSTQPSSPRVVSSIFTPTHDLRSSLPTSYTTRSSPSVATSGVVNYSFPAYGTSAFVTLPQQEVPINYTPVPYNAQQQFRGVRYAPQLIATGTLPSTVVSSPLTSAFNSTVNAVDRPPTHFVLPHRQDDVRKYSVGPLPQFFLDQTAGYRAVSMLDQDSAPARTLSCSTSHLPSRPVISASSAFPLHNSPVSYIQTAQTRMPYRQPPKVPQWQPTYSGFIDNTVNRNSERKISTSDPPSGSQMRNFSFSRCQPRVETSTQWSARMEEPRMELTQVMPATAYMSMVPLEASLNEGSGAGVGIVSQILASDGNEEDSYPDGYVEDPFYRTKRGPRSLVPVRDPKQEAAEEVYQSNFTRLPIDRRAAEKASDEFTEEEEDCSSSTSSDCETDRRRVQPPSSPGVHRREIDSCKTWRRNTRDSRRKLKHTQAARDSAYLKKVTQSLRQQLADMNSYLEKVQRERLEFMERATASLVTKYRQLEADNRRLEEELMSKADFSAVYLENERLKMLLQSAQEDHLYNNNHHPCPESPRQGGCHEQWQPYEPRDHDSHSPVSNDEANFNTSNQIPEDNVPDQTELIVQQDVFPAESADHDISRGEDVSLDPIPANADPVLQTSGADSVPNDIESEDKEVDDKTRRQSISIPANIVQVSDVPLGSYSLDETVSPQSLNSDSKDNSDPGLEMEQPSETSISSIEYVRENGAAFSGLNLSSGDSIIDVVEVVHEYKYRNQSSGINRADSRIQKN